MTANRYAVKCDRCGEPVGPREGDLVKFASGWRVLHQGCAEEANRHPDPIDTKYEDDCRDACGLFGEQEHGCP